jgi:hypothetical protein
LFSDALKIIDRSATLPFFKNSLKFCPVLFKKIRKKRMRVRWQRQKISFFSGAWGKMIHEKT